MLVQHKNSKITGSIMITGYTNGIRRHVNQINKEKNHNLLFSHSHREILL